MSRERKNVSSKVKCFAERERRAAFAVGGDEGSSDSTFGADIVSERSADARGVEAASLIVERANVAKSSFSLQISNAQLQPMLRYLL